MKVAVLAVFFVWVTCASPAFAQEPIRPKLLLPLYGSMAAMQTLDVVTTATGLGAGRRETNPFFSGGSVTKAVVFKAATTGLIFYTAERLWRRHPAAAIGVMVAANGVTAFALANNYRVLMAGR